MLKIGKFIYKFDVYYPIIDIYLKYQKTIGSFISYEEVSKYFKATSAVALAVSAVAIAAQQRQKQAHIGILTHHSTFTTMY